ncbi:MAG: hypothetical protein IJF70_05505 [Opitutales bacterium]|nr:hypothetical protein [Opitutales bacterium]
MSEPLLTFRPYQEEVIKCKFRQLFLLWRRQTGKSYTLAHCALIRMIKRPNHLVTMVSASVNIGGELLLKEAQIWANVLQKYRKICDDNKKKLITTADNDKGELLDIDAFADIFEHNKLEAKIYHSKNVVSRTRVIAPNPNTAVGWTGDIYMDEIGRIENFKDVYEAVLPIMDSHPEFDLRMATTPPPDDKHPTYEMFLPPSKDWEVNPRGNWYIAPCGMDAHRVDAWDGFAAGVKYFHPKTREILTPEQHRELQFDKTAWDRNHAVKFIAGGTAAVPLADIQRAMMLGRNQCCGFATMEEVKLG